MRKRCEVYEHKYACHHTCVHPYKCTLRCAETEKESLAIQISTFHRQEGRMRLMKKFCSKSQINFNEYISKQKLAPLEHKAVVVTYEVILSSIREKKAGKQGNSQKVVKQGRSPKPVDTLLIIVEIYINLLKIPIFISTCLFTFL